MISALMVFLLSSCVLPNLEAHSEYRAPEAREDLPENQQESDSQGPVDANGVVAGRGPLKIGIEQAILLAIENNQSLILERMNPEINRTLEEQELSAFRGKREKGESNQVRFPFSPFYLFTFPYRLILLAPSLNTLNSRPSAWSPRSLP